MSAITRFVMFAGAALAGLVCCPALATAQTPSLEQVRKLHGDLEDAVRDECRTWAVKQVDKFYAQWSPPIGPIARDNARAEVYVDCAARGFQVVDTLADRWATGYVSSATLRDCFQQVIAGEFKEGNPLEISRLFICTAQERR